MTAEEAAIEDLIAEVLRREDGETTLYVAEKARAVARAARVEALREAAEAVPPGRTDATDAFRAQIKAWLAARATAEDGRT